ncbi:uncharacterized protein LOC34619702 [Cyclospora cayetanensis]|uniref:Uncharacterized protein LOC34619702 n=1 Tax=Cyclospora cayetanensis TaxID=88456 RepID=A0A6P6RT90_9EIME|nr:uncharacterized protein LOC34619702 [Cyclospora cayetanensis]
MLTSAANVVCVPTGGYLLRNVGCVLLTLAVGLERLRSGAVLLTLELPSILEGANMLPQRHSEGSDGAAKGSKVLLRPSRGSLHRARQPVPFFSKSSGVPSASEGAPDAPTHSSKDNDGGASIFSLEASLLHRLAAPLVEAADVLVMPLLHPRCFAAQPSQDAWRADSLGEMLWLGDGDGEMNSDACSERAAIPPLRRGRAALASDEGKAAGTRKCQSAGGCQAKRRAESVAHREREGGGRERGILPTAALATHCCTAGGERLRAFKHAAGRDALADFLIGTPPTGPPSSIEFTTHALATNACAAAFRKCLMDAKKRLSGFQELHGKEGVSHSFGAMMQKVLAEALATYDHQTRPYQLSSERSVLRDELRRSVERALRLAYLNDDSGEGGKGVSCGSAEINGQEAVSIENDARSRLRAQLVAALQKDAERFESLAPGILRKTHTTALARHVDQAISRAALAHARCGGLFRVQALEAADKRLMCLLPPAAVGMTRIRNQQDTPSQTMFTDTLEHHSDREKALQAAASASRDAWLCRRFCVSLLEIHLVLLQKLAKNFSTMAVEMSQSPLAALLRRQHVCAVLGYATATCRSICKSALLVSFVICYARPQSRPWLGVSLRPALSIASLLRMRGKGNLQGYSRFTNDGEGLASGRPFAFRLQPKIHFDVEVD